MFEDLIKTLKNLDGTQISVPVLADPDVDGFIDLQCPAEECEFLFKVNADDWSNIATEEEVWCPFCGHSAKSDEWCTSEQIEVAKKAVFSEAKHKINQAMRRDAQRWNRKQPRDAFISMTMRVASRPKEIVLPASASEPMQLKISCAECDCRFAVIGSAYFCPACGHNEARHVFQQSLTTIRATLDALPTIAQSIEDRDTAENTKRHLTEDALQRVITAFQRYAEALFATHPSPPIARRNVFQNLSEGSALWKQAFGTDYESHLTRPELEKLNRYFQLRHLLAHREGLVDEDYISKSGDQAYKLGQRIVVRDASVRECLDLIEQLGIGLEQDSERESP